MINHIIENAVMMNNPLEDPVFFNGFNSIFIYGDYMETTGQVKTIIQRLLAGGYEAYLVGGSVRDMVLGRRPHDQDIITSASPGQVKKIFNKVIPVGEKHGTVAVVENKASFEVTSFNSLEQDLSRRDFTMNSLAMDINGKVYDYFGGVDDIKNKVIRTVGNPGERFKADPLRLMRAVRFAVDLGFSMHAETRASIIENCHLIKDTAAERVRDELCKILLSGSPGRCVRLLQECGLLRHIIPELAECVGFEQWNRHHDKDVFEHTLAVLDNTPATLKVRMAALLHDVAKPVTFSLDEKNEGHFFNHNIVGEQMARVILNRLKFSNDTIAAVTSLVREHTSRYNQISTPGVKRLIRRIGAENLDDLFALQLADISGSAGPFDTGAVDRMRQEAASILAGREPLSVKDLAISGRDLINMGFPPGPKIGEIIKNLLELVLENPQLNTRKSLKNIVKENRSD